MTSRRQAVALAGARALATIWCGMILGVSFIATPVKFTAPSIDFPTALDVGRVTFGLFGPIELGVSVALLCAALLAQRARGLLVVAILCLALTVLENFGLRPLLDARMQAIFDGRPLEPSHMHKVYVATQFVKVVALVAVGWARMPAVEPDASPA
ncbi:MAG: DUF4149 domain-containing protein [Pseudomonadota bacterium]